MINGTADQSGLSTETDYAPGSGQRRGDQHHRQIFQHIENATAPGSVSGLPAIAVRFSRYHLFHRIGSISGRQFDFNRRVFGAKNGRGSAADDRMPRSLNRRYGVRRKGTAPADGGYGAPLILQSVCWATLQLFAGFGQCDRAVGHVHKQRA